MMFYVLRIAKISVCIFVMLWNSTVSAPDYGKSYSWEPVKPVTRLSVPAIITDPCGCCGRATELDNFQCQCVPPIQNIVEQGPTVLAEGVGTVDWLFVQTPVSVSFSLSERCLDIVRTTASKSR